MKPYYQEGGIVIYHGDCREVLPMLSKVDLVLTDPPYGINAARKRNSQKWRWVDREVNGWDAERPDGHLIQLAVKSASAAIIWGGNYFTDVLHPTDKWLIWDKGQADFSLADVEMAWCSWSGAARRITFSRAAALLDGKEHPTQKPVAVTLWALRQAPKPAHSVVDPFMGSGTTLVACKRMGRQCVGVEIEEKYCEIAARRVEAERLTLFESTPGLEQSMLDLDESTPHRSDDWLRALGAQDAIKEELYVGSNFDLQLTVPNDEPQQ